jgi:hypothetical protein
MTRLLPSLLLVISICACSFERAPLVASDVTIARPIPGTEMTAAYFTLSNNTTQEVTITHVTSAEFESVQMHESVVEDGMARMYELGDLKILAGTSVQFQAGGKHLMLMRPIGDIDTVTLDFHAGKAVMLSVNVALTD